MTKFKENVQKSTRYFVHRNIATFVFFNRILKLRSNLLSRLILSLCALLTVNCQLAFGQNVGINQTGNSPNASAMLDVDVSPNNNLGLLIPRVTYAQRTTNFSTLPAVAQGLTVYQTDAGGDGEGYYYNTSTTTTPPG